MITTVAGAGEAGNSGDGGLAPQATKREPYSLQVDSGNNDIYIVDRLSAVPESGRFYRIISTVAGTGELGTAATEDRGKPKLLWLSQKTVSSMVKVVADS
ncbi:MAG: hypothetical protein Ct9H300mP11_22650 [Chloroflexota bacterium]|nr:MAG: hypothetical protein Ct9H300mP11_22650 [Chloroflexota bacterium]